MAINNAAVNSYERGLVLLGRGDCTAAKEAFLLATQADPGFVEAFGNYGLCCERLQDYAAAARAYRAGLAVRSDIPLLWANLSGVLVALREFSQARAAADQAISLDPRQEQARVNLGFALLGLKQLSMVLEIPTVGMSRELGALLFMLRGRALNRLGRFQEALAEFSTSRAESVSFVHRALAWSTCGESLLGLGRSESAAHCFHCACLADPQSYDARVGYAQALIELDRFDASMFALSLLAHAFRLQPILPTAPYNLGLQLLRTEKFMDGFGFYRFRDAYQGVSSEALAPVTPEVLRQPELKLRGEQGLGDQVLFYRALIWLKSAQPQLAVSVELDRRLIGSMVPLPSVTHRSLSDRHAHEDGIRFPELMEFFLTRGSHGVSGDFHVLQPSLIRIKEMCQVLRRLRSPDGRQLIGVSWKSTRAQGGDTKSASPEIFGRALRGSSLQPVLLQYDSTEAEIERFNLAFGEGIVRLEGLDLRNDIEGVIALTSLCDGVLTVSCTTAHFAGGLGIRGAVILPTGSHTLWYWGTKPDTPWYPTLRCFRQSVTEDWGEPLHHGVAFLEKHQAHHIKNPDQLAPTGVSF